MEKQKFNRGDRVKILVGHKIWITDYKRGGVTWVDLRPDLVGKIGIIDYSHNNVYHIILEESIKGIAWFEARDLELISK